MREQFFLEATNKPANTPEWLTQEHLEKCAANTELQTSWEPKVGDWYFCGDLYQVMQIVSLETHYLEGQLSLKTDRGKDSHGHWTCDIYLPEPKPVVASV